MKLFQILLITCLLVGANAYAYYPKAEIDFKNAKLSHRKLEELDDLWMKFLNDRREVLLKTNKKYTIDQFCSYSIESNDNGDLLYETIKQVKQKRENYAYNLAAIEFLRNQNLNIKKKKTEKPLYIAFRYYAF